MYEASRCQGWRFRYRQARGGISIDTTAGARRRGGTRYPAGLRAQAPRKPSPPSSASTQLSPPRPTSRPPKTSPATTFSTSPSPQLPPTSNHEAVLTPNPHPNRTFQTDKITPADASAILAKQRLSRPVSPHLEIYDKKQTWFGGSAWQRITGAGFSGALYASAVAYLAAPVLGWHLESSSLVAAAAALPVAVKGGLKFLVAWPFVFHAINGVRHLAFDLGIGFARSTIIKTGWYFWGASIVGGLYLAFFM